MIDKGSSYKRYIETRCRGVDVIQQKIAPSALSMEGVRTWVIGNEGRFSSQEMQERAIALGAISDH